MSASTACACDCCSGVTEETPLTVQNRPGLSAIAYRVGHTVGTKIDWGKNLRITGGRDPSVALTDDGTVIITYEHARPNLCRWTGTVKGERIEWSGDPLKYDDGERSSVAASCAGKTSGTASDAIMIRKEIRFMCRQ